MIHPDTLEQRNKDEQYRIGGDGSINGSQPSERCKRKNNRPRATRWTTVYRRALAAAPSAFAYTNPGNIYKSQQQPTEAERCFRQALATDADFYPAHYDRRIGSDVVPPTGTFRCRTVPSHEFRVARTFGSGLQTPTRRGFQSDQIANPVRMEPLHPT